MDVLSPSDIKASKGKEDYVALTKDPPVRFRTAYMLDRVPELKEHDSEAQRLRRQLHVLELLQLGIPIISMAITVLHYRAKDLQVIQGLVLANLALGCGSMALWYEIGYDRSLLEKQDQISGCIVKEIKLEAEVRLRELADYMSKNSLRLTWEQYARIKKELGPDAVEDLGFKLCWVDFVNSNPKLTHLTWNSATEN